MSTGPPDRVTPPAATASASALALAEAAVEGVMTLERPPPANARAAAWRRRDRVIGLVLANAAPLLLLLAWWLYSRSQPEFIMPSPWGVFEEAGRLFVGEQASQTWTSMGRIVIAVLLAMVIGGLLVFVAGVIPLTELLVGSRILPFFNSVPALGWAILGVIWFGIGNFAVVFVVTAIVIPFCMVNLWEGLRALDPELREMGRSFTRSRRRVLARIEMPLLLPYVFAAARLSFSVGWKVALIAEFFGASAGLGLVMNQARQNFDSTTVFACIIVVLVIVTAAERLFFEPLGKWFARRAGTALRV